MSIIYVNSEFKQQDGDTVIFSDGVNTKIQVADESLYSQWQISFPASIAKIDAKEKALSDHLISSHIYKSYPQEKQNHDRNWSFGFLVKLKAAGMGNVEERVLDLARLVDSENTPESLATAEVDSLDPAIVLNVDGLRTQDRKDYAVKMISVLIYIAIKMQWIEDCVLTMKSAMQNNEKVKSVQFPEFPFDA